MAVLAPVADEVFAIGAARDGGNASQTIVQGDVIYKRLGDKLIVKLTNAISAGSWVNFGVALNGAYTGQPVAYATGVIGYLLLGCTLEIGMTYKVSDTAGKIEPVRDLDVGAWVIRLGFAVDVDRFYLDTRAYEVTKP